MWTSWSVWGNCSETCGWGQKSRVGNFESIEKSRVGNFQSKTLGQGCQVPGPFQVLLKVGEPDRPTPSCLSLCGRCWLMLNHTTTASYYNVFQCISMVYFKARDCVNKEVGEGCPGEETQLQHCQERSCPGDSRWRIYLVRFPDPPTHPFNSVGEPD